MKKVNNSEHTAQNFKENFQLLTAIKEMVKTKSLRKEGFEKLQEIYPDELTPSNQVFYYYIKGRFYVLEYKSSPIKEIETLRRGDDCYSEMVCIAYNNKISIKQMSRHFSRAYCMYLLAMEDSSIESRERLLSKVDQICQRSLNYGSNSSFLWLQEQLSA
ncbi:MAG: hypothetical protein PSN34_11765 [Urechidicola sp.]|nr:hypothetical protein [Urechidicola sp.]